MWSSRGRFRGYGRWIGIGRKQEREDDVNEPVKQGHGHKALLEYFLRHNPSRHVSYAFSLANASLKRGLNFFSSKSSFAPEKRLSGWA